MSKERNLTMANVDSRTVLGQNGRPTLLQVCALLGLFLLAGCATAGEKDKKPTRDDVPTMGPGTIQELSKLIGSEPVLLFAVDQNGELIAVRNPKTSPAFPIKFKLKADYITSWKTFSVITTENPKRCWIDSSGTEKCVTW